MLSILLLKLTKQISPTFYRILFATPKQYIRNYVQQVVGEEEVKCGTAAASPPPRAPSRQHTTAASDRSLCL